MEFSLLHDWLQNFLKAIIHVQLVMFVFIFFACSLKTVVSKISAGFSKCGCELGGSVPVKVQKSSCHQVPETIIVLC